MAMRVGDVEHEFCADARPTPLLPAAQRRTFEGYLRPDGQVGTRNYIGVLSTVNCSASVSKFIAGRFPQDILDQYPNVDGVVSITHGTGCGMADRGEGYSTLQRTLWGFAGHPNFAAVLMVGLGCEVMQLEFMTEIYGIKQGPTFRTMTLQDTGGTRKTIERAHAIITEMLPAANEIGRRPVSVSSKLIFMMFDQASERFESARSVSRLTSRHSMAVSGRCGINRSADEPPSSRSMIG